MSLFFLGKSHVPSSCPSRRLAPLPKPSSLRTRRFTLAYQLVSEPRRPHSANPVLYRRSAALTTSTTFHNRLVYDVDSFFFSILEYRLHKGRGVCLFGSRTYPKRPEQCLAQRRHLVDVCCMYTWVISSSATRVGRRLPLNPHAACWVFLTGQTEVNQGRRRDSFSVCQSPLGASTCVGTPESFAHLI